MKEGRDDGRRSLLQFGMTGRVDERCEFAPAAMPGCDRLTCLAGCQRSGARQSCPPCVGCAHRFFGFGGFCGKSTVHRCLSPVCWGVVAAAGSASVWLQILQRSTVSVLKVVAPAEEFCMVYTQYDIILNNRRWYFTRCNAHVERGCFRSCRRMRAGAAHLRQTVTT